MIDIRIIQIKTNAQNLYGWIALSSTDHPIGHIFMHVELENKINARNCTQDTRKYIITVQILLFVLPPFCICS